MENREGKGMMCNKRGGDGNKGRSPGEKGGGDVGKEGMIKTMERVIWNKGGNME